jgi:hypothetical protein
MEGQLVAHCGATKLARADLVALPTPEETDTFKPIPHSTLIDRIIEGLSYRHISVVRDEYAVTQDGMRLFGVLDLETTFEGCRFSLGLRNANDKSMRLAMTVGYRTFVCDNMAFSGDFTPVLAKHSKHFKLEDAIDLGLGRMQRNFEPMQKQVESWRAAQITDDTAKLVIYKAFIEEGLDAPKHLSRLIHDLYFEPRYDDFQPRTMWSLSNAFTSAFKELDPVPQFKATAKLGEFLNHVS